MKKVDSIGLIRCGLASVVAFWFWGRSLYAATSVLIAEEDFEGGMSCKLSSVGSFPVAPGIKSGMGIGGSSAYGFGRSSCRYDAWDGYVNDIVFDFSRKYVITKVEFWEIERYDNWGSQGWLIANGSRIADTTFARLPSNDRTADTDFRKREFSLNVVSSSLTFRCWDITDLSELFIDNIKIYGHVYYDVLTVTFSANGGYGEEMNAQMFNDGKEQKLTKNIYRKDGYVFLGWATNSVDRANAGIVDYKDEASITVDSDMTLYAVWDNPALTLAAESANWSSGSITMRCEDTDKSGAAHEYTLEYKNASGAWEEVDGAKNVLATKGQDANSQEVWVAKLTDTGFSSRLGGIPPVEYRVKDVDNNRFSDPCVTRTKYGIFVAPGVYKPGRVDGEGKPIPPLQCAKINADNFEMLANDHGRFNGKVLTESSATYKELDDEFNRVADKIKPGDICFLYFGTHGGARKGSTVSYLELYDHSYSEQELANHVQSLNAVSDHNPKGNGVAVVGFVHACHSGGIIDNSGDGGIDGYCAPNAWCVNSVLLAENVAWVTATDDPKSLSFGNFFSEFLLEYGWKKGWADKNMDDMLSCEEVADYTKRRTNDLFDGITMMNEYGQTMTVKAGKSDAHGILKHIVIGESGHHEGSAPAPTAPKIKAEGTGVSTITVKCENIYNADAVVKFRRRGTGAPYEFWDAIGELNNNGALCELKDFDVANSGGDCPYSYQIRTYNGAGVGKSNETSAWRVHYEMLKIGFMYDIPNADYGSWQWSSSYGKSLGDSGIWENVHKKIYELDTDGSTLVGWFTERGGKGTKATKETIVYSDKTYYGWWTPMTKDWLDNHTDIATAANGDVATAAAMTAANGCRTVGECYALGIDPEDPDDDFRITHFEMKDGEPVITVNHTEDGSGNSFEDRVKTLGAKSLGGGDAAWADMAEVPAAEKGEYRFFKVAVELR